MSTILRETCASCMHACSLLHVSAQRLKLTPTTNSLCRFSASVALDSSAGPSSCALGRIDPDTHAVIMSGNASYLLATPMMLLILRTARKISDLEMLGQGGYVGLHGVNGRNYQVPVPAPLNWPGTTHAKVTLEPDSMLRYVSNEAQ
ncbi:hypothetical protein IG631_02777 [Alternaria alternata]|jgi:hypothetical protein|nr:hypothetical protein IG631_02777 [Alternaria alternata]